MNVERYVRPPINARIALDVWLRVIERNAHDRDLGLFRAVADRKFVPQESCDFVFIRVNRSAGRARECPEDAFAIGDSA